MVGVLMSVGVMIVGVMSVGEITVGVMTVGVMTVGVMRRPPYYKLFLYFNLCLSVMLDSFSCSFTSIFFITNTKGCQDILIFQFVWSPGHIGKVRIQKLLKCFIIEQYIYLINSIYNIVLTCINFMHVKTIL